MALALKGVFEGSSSLHAKIVETGVDLGGMNVLAYRTELLIFSSFPYDVLAVVQFGQSGLKVRAGLIEGIVAFARTTLADVAPGAVQSADFSQWPSRVEKRLQEHAETYRGGGQDSRDALAALGFAVAQHITGVPHPAIVMHLGLYFTGILSHMRKPIGEFVLQD
jgi:hypothetical protein